MGSVFFDHHKPAYRCCCNGCHVADGAKILCIAETILASIGLVLIIVQSLSGQIYGSGPFFNIFSQSIAVCFALLGYYGVKKWRPRWLLGCLIYHGIELFFVMFGVVMFAVWFFVLDGQQWFDQYIRHEVEHKAQMQGEKIDKQAISSMVAVVEAVVLLSLWLMLCMHAWFFSIILAAYKYVNDACKAGAQVVRIPVYNGNEGRALQAHSVTPGQVYVANPAGPKMVVNPEMQAFNYDEKPPAYDVIEKNDESKQDEKKMNFE